MDIMKKILHNVAFVLYIIVGMYALVFVSLLFGYKPLVIMNNSMDPEYKKGSVIYYKKYDNETINVGDIVTYNNDKELVSERVIGKDYNTYIVKGDNRSNKTSINEDQIIGINSNISIQLIGYLIVLINKNLIISIGLFIIIIVGDFLLNNKTEEKKPKKEKKEEKSKIDEEII